MILFKKDWVTKHPGAIADFKTTNQSFIRIAALYRDMGLQNHAFPLALHNPDLQGVDPFDDNLTEDQIRMIAAEVSENPWYFYREVIRIPTTGSAEPIKYIASRGNVCLNWMFFNHIFIILEQIRQTGKSVGVDSLMIGLMNGGTNNTQINLITKDETLRSFNLSRLKAIQETLPWYLNLKTPKDLSNTEMMTINALKNEYRSHLPNKSPKSALNVGRGMTSPVFHIDEGPFIFNIGITLPAALSAGTFARDFARINDQPYGSIMTGTAGKIDDPDGNYVYNMIQESAIFGESFYDTQDLEELEEVIRKNSYSNAKQNISGYTKRGVLRVYASFNHRQLGKSDEWLRRALEDSNSQGEEADRDFFNVWTSGSILSPISTADAMIIRKSERGDYHQEITRPGSYVLRWYLSRASIDIEMSMHDYILSIDTSDAVGGDDIGMTMRSVTTGAVVLAASFNETNLITFAEWLLNFLVRYKKVLLMIERRSSASVIIDYLLLKMPIMGIDPFKRIFNMVVQNMDTDKEFDKIVRTSVQYRPQHVYVQNKKHFGFSTSGSGATSRSALYEITLSSAVRYTSDTVHDKKTIDQLLSLIVKNGRVDHMDGGHDDLVISWLLSHWVMTNGRNLDIYGLNSSRILSEAANRVKEINSASYYEQNYDDDIRRKIDDLSELLKKEKDSYICEKYEQQMKRLYNQLSQNTQTSLSFDEMVKQIRRERTLRQRIR